MDQGVSLQHRRWWALACVACAFLLSFFQRFAPAGLAQDLAADFHTSAASLGALAATYFYVYTFMQIPTGMLVDTWGPRRILLVGGIVAALGSGLFGWASGLDAALLARTLIGLGVSVTFIAMLKIIALFFEESRFASLVGGCMLIGNLGSVLAGWPLSAMAQVAGWRSLFIGIAVLSLFLAGGCWWLVPDRQGAASRGAPRPSPSHLLADLKSVLANPHTWPPALVNLGVGGSFFAFGGLWAMPFLRQAHGLPRDTASTHLSVYFASFAVGCLVLGLFSDRWGRRKPVVVAGSLVHGVSWLVWLLVPAMPLSMSYGLFVAMGASTACFSLTWACAKEVNPPHLSGLSTAVANIGCFLAGGVLQPVVGWLLDQSWAGLMDQGARVYGADSYRSALLLVAGVAWLGAAAAWRIQETSCRNIWRPR